VCWCLLLLLLPPNAVPENARRTAATAATSLQRRSPPPPPRDPPPPPAAQRRPVGLAAAAGRGGAERSWQKQQQQQQARVAQSEGENELQNEATKACNNCNKLQPRSAFSVAGWQGRGWCQICRHTYNKQQRIIYKAKQSVAGGLSSVAGRLSSIRPDAPVERQVLKNSKLDILVPVPFL
jgi:hypothetical protein